MPHDLEHILDESIASYADGEPLAGLDERIMARIRLTPRRARRTAAQWATAAIVAAIAALWCMIPNAPQPVAGIVRTRTPLLAPLPALTERVVAAKRRGHVQRIPALPKQLVFPAPSPLTPEERRLVAMVAQDPQATAQAFASLRKRASEPLDIAPLVIPPLDPTEGQ